MQIKPNTEVQDIAREHIIVEQGSDANLTKIIALNNTAVYLFQELKGKTFQTSDVVQLLIAKYGISEQLAQKDAQSWINTLVTNGLIIE